MIGGWSISPSLPFVIEALREASGDLAALDREDLHHAQLDLATAIVRLELAARPQACVIDHAHLAMAA